MPTHIVAKARSAFPLGRITLTDNALNRLDFADILDSLNRHARGDWGELPPEDIRGNAKALANGGRLLSVYGTGVKRFWIITEADRSATTILLPLDY